jgi:5-methylcytosine-specific restriction endonuclease McrA
MFRPQKQTTPSREELPKVPKKKMRKQKIPKALREQVWLRQMGKVFEGKCPVSWCQNQITVFDFESGHNEPESKGGATTIDNLIPVCSRCNKSMSNNFTVHGWSRQFGTKPNQTAKWWMCFGTSTSVDSTAHVQPSSSPPSK